MKRIYIIASCLLLPILVYAFVTWNNVGTPSMQRQATAKGYFYRSNIGSNAPGFVYWYTQQQLDSLFALNVTTANTNYIRNQNSSAQTANAWITGTFRAQGNIITPAVQAPLNSGLTQLLGGSDITRGAYIVLTGALKPTTPASASHYIGDKTTTIASQVPFWNIKMQASDALPIGNTLFAITKDSTNSTNYLFAPGYRIPSGTSSQFLTGDGNTASILTGGATLNFPSTAANASSSLTITVSGVATGDVVSYGLPVSFLPGGQNYNFIASCTGTNTVTITFFNNSGSSMDPSAALFKVKVFK